MRLLSAHADDDPGARACALGRDDGANFQIEADARLNPANDPGSAAHRYALRCIRDDGAKLRIVSAQLVRFPLAPRQVASWFETHRCAMLLAMRNKANVIRYPGRTHGVE
ncbi:MAG: hypothetical protein H3C55_01570 [Pseudorhodoplanes sp.]|nr:hypothetical protein [Pseudorhodoplanes sp.]